MKLYQGASDARRIREVENLLAPLAIVWLSETDCQRALTDFRNLHLSHGLGLLDALIAATAIGQGATLVTFNARHFPRFPGSRPSKASTATVNGASWPLHQLVPGVRRDYWLDCRRRLTPHPSSGMIGCFVGWVGGTD